MNSYVKAEKKLNLLYFTMHDGNVEFMGSEEERIFMSDKLGEFSKEEIMRRTKETIISLQSEIQNHFKEME